MENLVTPSERAQSLINPHARSRSGGINTSIGLMLKIAFGTPIPLLLTLYMISMAVSETALSVCAALLTGFTFIYILIDRFAKPREFHFFASMADVPLLGYFVLCIVGLVGSWQPSSLIAAKQISWVLAYFLVMYAIVLFPGLNRLIKVIMTIVPFMALFVIWQKFFGLHADLNLIPASFAETIAGIDTVGFFQSTAAYGFIGATFMVLAAAALMVQDPRRRALRYILIAGMAITWLSLVTIQSMAVLVAPIAGIAVIFLYCRRSYFFILLILLGCAYTFAPKNFITDSFSAWMEKGTDVTQEKQDVARAEMAIFSDSPWWGAGYGSVPRLLPSYFKKLGINRTDSKLSSNNYFGILASTGFLGLALYMAFTLLFLLKTHRLWQEIPHTHYWHRAFVMGAMGVQVVFHTMGLYENMLNCLAAMLILAFFLSLVSYLNESYGRNIIPDDYSL